MAKQVEKFQFFEVGGCVRDSLLGIPSKDIDFSVVAPKGVFATADSAFLAMEAQLSEQGFQIFESRREFLTIRARVPKGHALEARTTVADFVLARKDGPYSDGRHPDWVKPGTLHDDLARRDFSSGAIAKAIDGSLIDPFGGVLDIRNKILRFVGNPADRIREDGLRVLRGFRFQITKGFIPDDETYAVLRSDLAVEMLACVSRERVREELNKMFMFSTLDSLHLLGTLPDTMAKVIFSGGLRLDATMKM
jgi:tRNA nucleotidyltransferase (CCA-adding enzyme)